MSLRRSMQHDMRQGSDVLSLYNAAHELSKRLDEAGIATIFSKIRNVPKKGSKEVAGSRCDMMPIPGAGLLFANWPHRHWTDFKSIWESRHVWTENVEAALQSINSELAKLGPRPACLAAAFQVSEDFNARFRKCGFSINWHVLVHGGTVEPDVFFLSVTPWTNGQPQFPPGVSGSATVKLGTFSSHRWDVLAVWNGPGERSLLTAGFESVAQLAGRRHRSSEKVSLKSSDGPASGARWRHASAERPGVELRKAMRMAQTTITSLHRRAGA